MDARRFAAVFGAVYVLVGIAGFAVTGLSDFAATSSDKLILLFIAGSSDLNLLNLNQPDNVLHLGSAVLGLYFGLAGRRRAAMA